MYGRLGPVVKKKQSAFKYCCNLRLFVSAHDRIPDFYRSLTSALQSLSVAMGAEVLVEEVVLDHLAEGWVVGDPLVEVEVQIDDLLDDLLDLVVEGDAHVLRAC